jgi:hypothetical protein
MSRQPCVRPEGRTDHTNVEEEIFYGEEALAKLDEQIASNAEQISNLAADDRRTRAVLYETRLARWQETTANRNSTAADWEEAGHYARRVVDHPFAAARLPRQARRGREPRQGRRRPGASSKTSSADPPLGGDDEDPALAQHAPPSVAALSVQLSKAHLELDRVVAELLDREITYRDA